MANVKERTVVIVKPDAMHRSLLGEILHRFERKGLKVVGLKMLALSDTLLDEHYAHHKDKAFFADLKRFMQSSPVAVLALEGLNAVAVVRELAGPTAGYNAPAGSIRGDFSISTSSNIVHASDSLETAQIELKRFFDGGELFDYTRVSDDVLYGSDERAR